MRGMGVMRIDRRPRDLVADEEHERLEEVREASAWWPARGELPREPSEDREQDQAQHDLENHVLRDAEA